MIKFFNETLSQGPENRNVTIEDENYVLVVVPVKHDSRPGVRAKLEEMARTEARVRARQFAYLGCARQREQRYADSKSLSQALDGWAEGNAEIGRLKPMLSVSAVSDGWALALLGLGRDFKNIFRERLKELPSPALDTAYCSALYPKAKALLDAGEYEKALPVYKELYNLKWATPTAYLDAAECFLYTGARKDAGRLIEETIKELGEAMDSAMVLRAGDIMFESEEEEKAEHLYRLASEKLRREK